MNARLFFGGVLAALPLLLLLSSCGGKKADVKAGGVFVTFDGAAVIKDGDYEPALEVLKGREPGLAKMWDALPAAQKRMIVQMIIDQKKAIEIAKKFVAAEGLDKTAEYKKHRAEMMELVEGDLAIKALQTYIGKNIKPDAKAYYNEHRAKEGAFLNPAFVITPGGAAVVGVAVATPAEADALIVKAKTAGDLKAAGAKVQDFGMVTPTSKIDRMIMGKALSMAPGFDKVEGADKKIWVIQVKSKQEPTFKEFDTLAKEMQDEIKQYAEAMMMQEALGKKFDELEKSYKVVVHKEALEKLFPEPLPEKPVADAKAAPAAPAAPAPKAA
jgi:hypothetical protein